MTTKNSSETVISKAYCYILQDFFSNQVQFLAGLISVQLEDRIVNPDLRDHSLLGPILNPEITTGRAPYWASGAKSSSKVLFFKIQDMNPQNHILSFLLHYFD